MIVISVVDLSNKNPSKTWLAFVYLLQGFGREEGFWLNDIIHQILFNYIKQCDDTMNISFLTKTTAFDLPSDFFSSIWIA